MVVLVGEIGDGLLAALAHAPGVSVARAPAAAGDGTAAGETAAARPGWEAGALALREAGRRRSMYVIVPDDPLADVAAGWRAMWDGSAGPGGAAGFEHNAAAALAAWRDKRFELPGLLLVRAGQPWPASQLVPGIDEHLLEAGRPAGAPIPFSLTAPSARRGRCIQGRQVPGSARGVSLPETQAPRGVAQRPAEFLLGPCVGRAP